MIVVPIGDEKLSFRALKLAIKVAKSMNEKILLISSLYGGDRTHADDIRRFEALLDRAEKAVREEGIEVERRLLVRGRSAGEDIVDVAEEVEATMIVMGCGIVRMESGVELRKTTEYVVLHTTRPLLLVK